MQQSLLVCRWVDSRKGADINASMLLFVPFTIRPGMGAIVLPLGACGRMETMFSPCCSGGRVHVHMSREAEEFIVVPDVFAANAAEIGDGRR